MEEYRFCGACRHRRWEFDVWCCRPGPPVERTFEGWRRELFVCERQNADNRCLWYEPNVRERLRRWWRRNARG